MLTAMRLLAITLVAAFATPALAGTSGHGGKARLDVVESRGSAVRQVETRGPRTTEAGRDAVDGAMATRSWS